MTTAVQLRRGTTAEHATFTGLEGETTVDTTKDTLVVHNGSTAGGFPIAREDLANVSPTNLPAITGADTASDDTFLIYDQSALTLKKITRAELNNAMEQDPLANVQIVSGTINGTTIGGTTAAGGSFTTLSSNSTTTLNGTTIPASKTLVDTDSAQTLTNKTISGSNNTLSNIGNSSLTNSSIGFTYSGGVTGSASVSLGGSNALSLSNVPNSSLQNSSITFGSTAQALGSTVSALNGVSIGATTASTGAFTNLSYTGTLTGGTGVVNLGSGQFYKDASGNVGIGTSSPGRPFHVATSVTSYIARFQSSNDPLAVINFKGNATGDFTVGAGANGENLVLLTNTTERMRITSNGVVHVTGTGFLSGMGGNFAVGGSSGNGRQISLDASSGKIQIRGESGGWATGTYFVGSAGTSRGGFGVLGNNDSLDYYWIGSEWNSGQFVLTNAGNVGIGTISPGAPLDVLTNPSANGISLRGRSSDNVSDLSFKSTDAATVYGQIQGRASDLRIQGNSALPITFFTNNTERMRIDSSGNLLVGTTTTSPVDVSANGVKLGGTGYIVNVQGFQTAAIAFGRASNTGGILDFYYRSASTVSVGSISTNGSTITFSGNALSDARHKENIAPISNAIDAINAVDFVTFNYKANGQASAGVTAQQAETVEAIKPFVINGASEEDYKAFDYNALIGYLGKAIQELNAIVDSQREELDTVKAELQTLKGN